MARDLAAEIDDLKKAVADIRRRLATLPSFETPEVQAKMESDLLAIDVAAPAAPDKG